MRFASWVAVLVLAVPATSASGHRASAFDRPGVVAGFDGDTGRRLFRTETKGPAALSLVLADEDVIVAERRGCGSADLPEPDRSTVLVGYDARSGQERWHQRAGRHADPAEHATPGVLPARDAGTGERIGLDPRTGRVRWARGAEPDLVRASTPRLLVLGADGHDGTRLTAVDRLTGETRWTYEIDGGRTVRLVGADDSAVVAIVGDPPAATFEQATGVGVAAHVLSADTGALRREIPLSLTTPEKLAMRSVVVSGSTMVLDVGSILGVDMRSGTQRWRSAGTISSTQLHGRNVLLTRTGAGGSLSLTALDPRTGHRRWVHDLGRFDEGAAATAGGIVVFERGGYTALDAATGRTRWHLGSQRGLAGVPGMAARDLYLVGGCPVTRAD
jgi:outer membrane protein assembly factor BamB